jgi:prepilin-type N-terminal cleavage/methylation domain-containing protein
MANPSQAGFTLAELLAALAITGIVMVPLTDLMRASTDSAGTVASINRRTSDLRFALGRIAARATVKNALPVGAVVPPESWLAPMTYTVRGSQLIETDTSVNPARQSMIASDVAGIRLTAPETVSGLPLLTIELPSVVDGIPVVRSRTVRVGGAQ